MYVILSDPFSLLLIALGCFAHTVNGIMHYTTKIYYIHSSRVLHNECKWKMKTNTTNENVDFDFCLRWKFLVCIA